MGIISLPSERGAPKTRWTFIKLAGLAESEFTKQAQVTEWVGDALMCEVSLPPLERADAAIWVSRLLALDGVVNTFYWGPDGDEREPLGNPTGTPAVNGGGQTGKTLAIDGFTGTLGEGSWLDVVHSDSIHRLYMLVEADLVGPGTGKVRPHMRAPAPADNAAVNFHDPVGLFRLLENQSWDIDTAQKYGITFKAVEAI